MNSFPILLLLTIINNFIPLGLGYHSSLCNAITKFGPVQDGGGIGSDNFPFDMRDKFHPDTTCNPKGPNCNSQEDDEVPTITVYSVKNRLAHGVVLNGWLRVNIKFKYPIDAYFIAGEIDEAFELLNSSSSSTSTLNATSGELNQAKGEFVAEFPTSSTCPRSDATKYQVVPCGGIGRSELTVPTGVLYVDPRKGSWLLVNQRSSTVINSTATARTEFNLYYRFSDYYCTVRRFYFRLFAVISNGTSGQIEVRPGRSPHIIPSTIMGAYDPLPKPEQGTDSGLDCSQQITGTNPPWIHESKLERLDFGSKATCLGNDDEESEGVTLKQYRFGSLFIDTNDPEEPTYKSARCSHGNTIQTPEVHPKAQLHYCEIDPDSQLKSIIEADQYESYETYVNSLYEKNKGKCDCSGVIFPKELEPKLIDRNPEPRRSTLHPIEPVFRKLLPYSRSTTAKTDPDSKDGQLDVHRGIRIGVKTGKILWRSRVGHGVMMVILSMFITPVGIFVTRYYKETFMDIRILYSRVWSVVHFQLILCTWVFLIAGIICIGLEQLLLGVSLTMFSWTHRNLGWALIVIYAVMTLFGGIRCIDDSSRKICICCHWFWGLFFYYGSLANILLSIEIPGSPIADDDESFQSLVPQTDEAIFIIGMWIAIDLVIHGVMTIHMCSTDIEVGVESRRMYLPVPIPLVREDELFDSPKAGFRKGMLCLYIFFSFVFTIILCVKMSKMSHEGRGFGPMSCTHYNLTTVRPHFKESCNWAKTINIIYPEDQKGILTQEV